MLCYNGQMQLILALIITILVHDPQPEYLGITVQEPLHCSECELYPADDPSWVDPDDDFATYEAMLECQAPLLDIPEF